MRQKIFTEEINKTALSSNEYLNGMDSFYKNIEQSNPNKKHKTIILLEAMIADMQ